METQYNQRNPAVKRLMKEAAELHNKMELYHAQPLDDNLFEWHFTVRGPPDTDFDGGIYHGRIILPTEYPMKPPSIMLLTPNGRFETNKKICLSISGYHPESWQPSWSIRTALLAIIGFMPTHGGGAIGSLDYSNKERQIMAKRSLDWHCSACGLTMRDALPALTDASKEQTQEARKLAQQIQFEDEASNQARIKQQAKNNNNDASAAAASTNADQTETTTQQQQQQKDNNTTTTSTTTTVPESETSATTGPSPTTPTPAQQLRQRIGREAQPSPTSTTTPQQRVQYLDHPSTTPQNTPTSTGVSVCHVVLIVMVALCLIMLCFRRLFINNQWRLGDVTSMDGSSDVIGSTTTDETGE